MWRPLIVLALALIFTGKVSAQYVYQTSFPTGPTNEVNVPLTAGTQDLRITGFDLYLLPGTYNLWISYIALSGTSSGTYSDLGFVTVNSMGFGAPTVIPIGFDVVIPQNQTYVFRFTTVGSAPIGVDTSLSQLNYGQLGLAVGQFQPFVGSAYVNAEFCGRIRYSDQTGGPRSSLQVLYGPPLNGVLSQGVTFDIEARDRDIILDGISIHAASNVTKIRLFTTEAIDSAANVPLTSSSWRELGDTGAYATTPGQLHEVPFDLEVVIPKGKRRGFYMVEMVSGALDAYVVLGGGGIYESGNADLSYHSGQLVSGLFGTPSNPGVLNCNLRYRVPGAPTTTAGAFGSLSTSATPTVNGRGIAFDLSAASSVNVQSLSGTVRSTAVLFGSPTTTLELWTTIDGASHQGQLGNPANWRKIGMTTALLPPGGSSAPFVILGTTTQVPAGGSRGFYLTTSAPDSSLMLQSGLASPGILASNGSLSVTTGTVTTSPFAPGAAGHGVTLTVGYQEPGRADLGFRENFESANVVQAPAGWLSSWDGNTSTAQGWRFDNPAGRPTYSPMSGKTAIFDSNWSGPGNPVAGSLQSPRFDASRDLDYELHFQSRFASTGSSQGVVEVWDGTNWNLIASMSPSSATTEHLSFDIGAAAGGSTDAMVRFRYQGNGDLYWMLDDVGLGICQKGQRPQIGIGKFDVNYAKDALHGQPVACGLPGPYVATASIYGQTIFHWEGEPNQPIQLFAGYLNLGNEVLVPQGQLDVGSYDPLTGTFPGIYMLADGTLPDIFNAAFRTSGGGDLTMSIYFPPYLAGFVVNMQSVVYSSIQNIALTNVVTLSIN
ncbi:MAG: hypothetical protein H6807_17240 [Planctomycetes bacterium]|nr:hypothetical protein [Planctomycetota bacterium]